MDDRGREMWSVDMWNGNGSKTYDGGRLSQLFFSIVGAALNFGWLVAAVGRAPRAAGELASEAYAVKAVEWCIPSITESAAASQRQ